jgi:hypothetical protein
MVRGMCVGWVALAAMAAAASGCGDDDPPYRPAENAGATCDSVADCYPGLDPADLQGDVECMDRVTDGYCTHSCQDDGDCCAVIGECATDHPQVCSPFESTPDTYCLLSCEPVDVGSWDANEYCQHFAHYTFNCRSSGGGSGNRKVCMP